MRKFILGFIAALALIGIGYGVYYFLTPRDFGDLKVTATSNGKPVAGLEIDVDKKPGPPKYRIDTDENGIALFEKLPVGAYAVFFNDASFPSDRLEKPEGGIIWVDVAKDQMTETKINLKAVKDVFPNACTMEAKLCPDGSYVGRTGPNCEFTPCP